MITTADSRLDELVRLFFDGTTAPRASAMIRKNKRANKPNLSKMLRYHTSDIDDKLTWVRDAFDYLLEFYSLLEIASLLRSLPEPLPSKLATQAKRDLSHPAVQVYYEDHYPLLLPQLFLLRLKQKNTLHEAGKQETCFPLFAQFLSLVDSINDDDEVETFQWFLDDGERDGYSIDDTLEVMSHREEFLKRFFSPPDDWDALDQSLHGFQRFVDFCVDFNRLLEVSKAFPRLQSAMWHFFSYWFDELGDKVGTQIGEAARLFLNWKPTTKTQRAEAEKEVQRYVASVERALKKLTSGKYGEELKKLGKAIGPS